MLPVDTYPPRPLSAKAKGKQRARDDNHSNGDANTDFDANSSHPQEPVHSRTLTIRFTEGVEDLVLSIGEKEAVRDIKKKIRLERPAIHNRRLRLIHSGRMLTDGTFLYGWLTSLEGRQRRANGRDGDEAEAPTASAPVTWLHCSIGTEMSAEDEEEAPQHKEETTPLRGFDRLQTAGFTEDEIETIRRQFRSSRGLDDNPAPLDDDYDEHARALEEQWIDDLDGAAGPVDGFDTTDGLYTTLLEGVTTGFFFGLLPFFLMRQSRPPAFFSDGYEQVDHVPSVIYS
ncbi:hypothetical protein FRB95_007323 [Tulasnella sp. JGI-2019a]|nr:hypothetical protein FRB93_011188 [Tulasnella sp. JGI-2019a]KAG9037028.1 hypothetical protein FRB95_007323 [Tulasnella sp. JGI-2019a]